MTLTVLGRSVAAGSLAAALLLAPSAASAWPGGVPRCGPMTSTQVDSLEVGMTRWTVEHMGSCKRRIWIHDGRMQKRYRATEGELRVNYNEQPDGKWTLTNGFWMTPNGAGALVVGQ